MILLAIVVVLMFFLKSPVLQPFSNPLQSSSIALGFIMVFAFLFGKKLRWFKLPQITGFIIAGVLCGPYVLKFLSVTDVKNLQLIDGLALGLIALTAGGEMRMKKLKGSFKSISAVVFFQTFIILAGFVVFSFVGRAFFPEMTLFQNVAVSILLGTLATATSPSTTIAIITECKSRGKYTDFILSTSVVKDFFVIILFAFSIAISKSLISPVKSFDFGFIGQTLRDVGGSAVIGIIIGGGIILYLKFIKKDITLFILSIAFFTYQISRSYEYHPLLICLMAGFIVQNLSSQGESLILAIEKISVPVYVVFFAISGASLDLGALKTTWLLALICVVWRGVLKFFGTFTGAKFAKDDPGIQKYSWAGFISQAGVALGMAVVIENVFPEWGGEFKAFILAVIAINQIIGPILLQKLLIKVGEAGKRELNLG